MSCGELCTTADGAGFELQPRTHNKSYLLSSGTSHNSPDITHRDASSLPKPPKKSKWANELMTLNPDVHISNMMKEDLIKRRQLNWDSVLVMIY